MTYKQTILYHCRGDTHYHFYFDQADKTYKLQHSNDEAKELFMQRIGKILNKCPLSDTILTVGSKKFKAICPITKHGPE